MKRAVKSIFILLAALFVALLILFNVKIAGFEKELVRVNIDSYDSTRLEDTLVLYSSEYDRNEYGYELLISKGTSLVLDTGCKVKISEGTYALSAHGKAAELIKSIEPNDKLEIKNGQAIFTRNIFLYRFNKLMCESNEINKIIEQKQKALCDIDNQGINKANDRLMLKVWELLLQVTFSEIDEEYLDAKFVELGEIINKKYYYTLQNRAVDGRGMWHRPNNTYIDERTLDGVKELAKKAKELGINTLYVETLWNGMTTYKSDFLGIQHPAIAGGSYGEYGEDYLLALISECHKVGIEVHAWVEVLNANFHIYEPQAYLKEEWVCNNSEDGDAKPLLDPSNPEVVDFLLSLIEEMLDRYDLDGISYDYIRYSGEYGGICEGSVKRFSEEYGYNGESLIDDLLIDSALRKSWSDFRTKNITSLVKRMSDFIRDKNKNIVISASPYGYIDYAKRIFMQDIDTWLKYGYLDVVLPMIYTENKELLKSNAENFVAYSDRVLQYTGIAPLYYGATIRVNQELIDTVYSLGISGSALFSSNSYILPESEEWQSLLAVMSGTTHKGSAVSPTADPSEILTAFKAQLEDRYTRLYKSKMTESERQITEGFIGADHTLLSLEDVINALTSLSEFKENVSGFENNAVKDRINEDIDYIYDILNAAVSRELIRYGYWDIEKDTHREYPLN